MTISSSPEHNRRPVVVLCVFVTVLLLGVLAIPVTISVFMGGNAVPREGWYHAKNGIPCGIVGIYVEKEHNSTTFISTIYTADGGKTLRLRYLYEMPRTYSTIAMYPENEKYITLSFSDKGCIYHEEGTCDDMAFLAFYDVASISWYTIVFVASIVVSGSVLFVGCVHAVLCARDSKYECPHHPVNEKETLGEIHYVPIMLQPNSVV